MAFGGRRSLRGGGSTAGAGNVLCSLPLTGESGQPMAGWPATLTACVALCALLAGAHGASESLVADPTAAQASQAQWGAASAKLGEAVGRVLAQEEFDTLVYLEVDPDQFGRDKPQQIDDDDEPLGVRRGVARLGSTGGGVQASGPFL